MGSLMARRVRGGPLVAMLLVACGGAGADGEGSAGQDPPDGGTDLSALTVEIGGERWTGFDCRQRVIRAFRSASSGRVPAVPAMCTIDGLMQSSIELLVQGSIVGYETGSWTGDEVERRVAVDFEADGHELDTRTGVEPGSTLQISTWDSTGLIRGELDLLLPESAGGARITGPFTIAFEVH
jgi:hypothetical protein